MASTLCHMIEIYDPITKIWTPECGVDHTCTDNDGYRMYPYQITPEHMANYRKTEDPSVFPRFSIVNPDGYFLQFVLTNYREPDYAPLEAIHPERGLPHDMHPVIKKIALLDEEDVHSHTYYLLPELLDYDYKKAGLLNDDEEAEIIDTFFITLNDLKKMAATEGHDGNHIRLIFWIHL